MSDDRSGDRQEVKITGISIPFMDLVVFFVRAGVAMIPAAFLVIVAVFFFWLLFSRLAGI
jgi:hypothetical protein